MSDNKGLGRFFKGDDNNEGAVMRGSGEAEKTIGALQARITELEGAAGRQSFIDMDEDALTQIAAEDAAVIIRAARMRAGKLIEQATETLQQAESEREQIRASCELDARQTREAANVDARKLRAEATTTLETARDQASQLLEATQNDADSQADENQKVIAKLLEDATRRATELATEADALRVNVDKEISAKRALSEQEINSIRASIDAELKQLRADAEKSTSAQIAAAQAEAKRLQTESTLAAQSMLEKATGDARALGEDANKTHSATISEAQIKLQQAETQAEQILAQAQTKVNELTQKAIKEAQAESSKLTQDAIAYRETVLASIDANHKIFDDLTKQISDLREQWSAAQFTLTHISNEAGHHFSNAEAAAAEVFSRISSSREVLTQEFANFKYQASTETSPEEI